MERLGFWLFLMLCENKEFILLFETKLKTVVKTKEFSALRIVVSNISILKSPVYRPGKANVERI